jgi:hypothetical protein
MTQNRKKATGDHHHTSAEEHMKGAAFVFASLLAVAGAAEAQEPAQAEHSLFAQPEVYRRHNLQVLEKRYLFSLQSDNDGVVESAIAQVVWMKMVSPGESLNDLRAELGSLSVCGRSVNIRYKSYLAGLVFDSPSLFDRDESATYTDAGQLFTALSGRLQEELIGQNRRYVRPE